MSSPIVQYSARRSRRSWSLSESDAKTLATVDEEEMFVFDDEDLNKLKLKKNVGFHKTAIKDLDTDFCENIPERFLQLQLGSNKTEIINTPPSHRRSSYLYESNGLFRSHSPYTELASSTESEKSVSMSIESLRNLLQSCATCGVVWCEDQVSLDCQECGGYTLDRPCPKCDGTCPATWTRDIALTHQLNKARWEGKCQLDEIHDTK